MTNREFNKLAEPLLRNFPQFARHKKLLYWPIQDGLLRGVFFDSSAFSKTGFYVYVLVMPLFVPSEHLTLSLGDRLRINNKYDNWNCDAADTLSNLHAAILDQALPFLHSVETISRFTDFLRNRCSSTERNLEALGYSLAKQGFTREAASVFERIPPDLDVSIPWQKELHDRAVNYRATLLTNPDSAIEELTIIESQTKAKLGLLH